MCVVRERARAAWRARRWVGRRAGGERQPPARTKGAGSGRADIPLAPTALIVFQNRFNLTSADTPRCRVAVVLRGRGADGRLFQTQHLTESRHVRARI